jgi:hypothetical protein
LNAVWALMNAAYRTHDLVKQSIMRSLGSDRFLFMLTEADVHSPIVIRLLTLLANILADVALVHP